VSSCGTQAGKEPARMTIHVGTEKIKTIDVTAIRAAPQTDVMQVHLRSGQTRLAAEFINDFYDPEQPDPRKRDRNLIVVSLEVRGPLASEVPNVPDSQPRLITAWPAQDKKKGVANGKSSRQCAAEILERFASRAYRRPVRPDEIDRLLKLFEIAEREGD